VAVCLIGHATFRFVDSCAGIRTRSDQFMTSGSSRPIVHAGPEHPKVVHPCGSQRGSQPRYVLPVAQQLPQMPGFMEHAFLPGAQSGFTL
jgi:hypothetical protein